MPTEAQARRVQANKARHTQEFYDVAYADESRAKLCSKCGGTKHVKQFIKATSRPDGFTSHCTACRREADKKRDYVPRKEDPEVARRRSLRNNRKARLQKFGIDETVYQAMLTKQNGVCAICHETCYTGYRLAVDHCHTGGHVRGLLCRRCNQCLGLLKDDPVIVERALNYLLRL